jgi:AcrR family transcriptional regulator
MDTKKRILEESEKLFADKGFDSTGIDEIAKNVGITKSVIYYHFKNKDEILQRMMEIFFDDALEFKKQIADLYFADPKKYLKQAIVETIKFGESRKQMAKILLMESIKNSDQVPLFKYWEERAPVLTEMHKEKIKDITTSDIMLQAFFMHYLPYLGYLVFSDRFCDYFNIEEEEMREKFVNFLTEYYEKIFKPKILKV